MSTARPSIVIAGLVLVACCTAQVARAATPADVCASAKRKAAGRKASAKLNCASKAAAAGGAIAPSCLARAEAKFAAAYAKAEAKGGCTHIGNAAGVEATVDGCVGAVQSALAVLRDSRRARRRVEKRRPFRLVSHGLPTNRTQRDERLQPRERHDA